MKYMYHSKKPFHVNFKSNKGNCKTTLIIKCMCNTMHIIVRLRTEIELNVHTGYLNILMSLSTKYILSTLKLRHFPKYKSNKIIFLVLFC